MIDISPFVRTGCTRHCSNGCLLRVAVRPGGSLAVSGDPDHPFTRGLICAKTARFGERLNSPRRILAPQLRQPDGTFAPVSWDAALGMIATRLDALRETPERILHVHYYASFGVLHRASRHLFGALGASGFSGSPCLGAGAEATRRDFGAARDPLPRELLKAARIVNFGRNLAAQSPNVGRIVAEAREKGVPVLAVHPGDADHSRYADVEVRIRPGTDRFLAAAVCRLLLDRGRVAAMARERAADYAAFEALLSSLDVDALLAACGVNRAEAELLADWYGADGPTATIAGRGLQRFTLGGENVRWLDALAMLSGNVGREGGGISLTLSGPARLGPGWPAPAKKPARVFPLHDLAGAVERADPPVEFVWVEGMNLVTMCADSAALADMLASRFTVVVEPFWTDTARAATLVLPPAMLLETEDIVAGVVHPYVHYSAPVVAPRGECRTNYAIARDLGARLARPVAFPEAEAVLEKALAKSPARVTLAELQERGFAEACVPPTPWEDGVFAHPDGLYRFPDALTPEPEAPEGYPLRLVSFVGKSHLLSQIPEEEQAGPSPAIVSPECPALAGLDLDRPVELVTPLGRLPVRLATRPGLSPEVVQVERGGWMACGRGLNALIEARATDMGGQIAYYGQYANLTNGVS